MSKNCPFALVGLIALASMCGCVPQRASRLPRPNASPAVKSGARFAQAHRQFAAHDYAGALATINGLAASPDLTPGQQAFYRRQKQICQDALGGKKATAQDATAPLPFTPSVDCGPRALLLLCADQRIAAPPLGHLCHIAGTNRNGTTLEGLSKAAQSVGLVGDGVQMDQAALAALDKPAIAWVDGSHYVAVLGMHTSLAGVTSATIHDPNEKQAKQMPVEELLRRSGGVLLTLHKAPTVVAARG